MLNATGARLALDVSQGGERVANICWSGVVDDDRDEYGVRGRRQTKGERVWVEVCGTDWGHPDSVLTKQVLVAAGSVWKEKGKEARGGKRIGDAKLLGGGRQVGAFCRTGECVLYQRRDEATLYGLG